jgi:hypothetical protein
MSGAGTPDIDPSWAVRASPCKPLGDVVAVAHPGLGGVCCYHAMTGIVEQQILQEVIGFLPGQSLVGLVR